MMAKYVVIYTTTFHGMLFEKFKHMTHDFKFYFKAIKRKLIALI